MSARNTLEQKAIRREERKLRKGKVSTVAYSYTDVETQSAKITQSHKEEAAYNQMVKERFNIVRPIWNLDSALTSLEARVARFLGKKNKYQPHQGKSEIARRQRQIKAGILQFTGA